MGIGHCTTYLNPFELPLPDGSTRQFGSGPSATATFCNETCFPFHATCYKILREVLGVILSEDDISALYNILCSIRYKYPSLRWGYGYGGVQQFQKAAVILPNCDNYWIADPTRDDSLREIV
jgi:hypothetical protein